MRAISEDIHSVRLIVKLTVRVQRVLRRIEKTRQLVAEWYARVAVLPGTCSTSSPLPLQSLPIS